MVPNFKNVLRLSSHLVKSIEMQSNFNNEKLVRTVVCNVCCARQKLNFHTDMPRMKDLVKLGIRRAAKEKEKKELSLFGTSSFGIEEPVNSQIFPTHDLPQKLFDGIPFKDIPIVVINCTKNNTIFGVSDGGITKLTRSTGEDGYKNARKGTNVAAQTTGMSFAVKIEKIGYKTVRVVLKGFGPGRMSSIKGLQLGGLNIISITDATVDSVGPRPRKQRRL